MWLHQRKPSKDRKVQSGFYTGINFTEILSIYIVIYIAPLQGNYSEALPGPAKEESLEEFIKVTGKVLRQRTKVRGKTIPNRGTRNREFHWDCCMYVSVNDLSNQHNKTLSAELQCGELIVEKDHKIRRGIHYGCCLCGFLDFTPHLFSNVKKSDITVHVIVKHLQGWRFWCQVSQCIYCINTF